MTSSPLVLGVDFDHTIIDYTAVLADIVRKRGLLTTIASNKKNIRDIIRLLPQGEIEWQKIQEEMYGQRITEAQPAAGVFNFLRACQEKGIRVCVVSHKTEYSHLGTGIINFRTAARRWMKDNAFFSNGIGLAEKDVFFEPTRREKIQRIGQIGCTHFIDDLEEVFLDSSFPQKVVKILYASPPSEQLSNVIFKKNWKEIHGYFFG